MRKTTKKLSGVAKDRFLRRFYAAEPGLAVETVDRLARRSAVAFSSIRVRRAVLRGPFRSLEAATGAQPRAVMPPVMPAAPAPAATAPKASKVSVSTDVVPVEESTEFDPFAFGLVPVYQREGREGLLARLASVPVAADLRRMAREQQIVLPQALRSGDAPAEEIALGIADAVGKRMADRKAAAGG